MGPLSLLRFKHLLFLFLLLVDLSFPLDLSFSLYLWGPFPFSVLNICYFCCSCLLICYFRQICHFRYFCYICGAPPLVRLKNCYSCCCPLLHLLFSLDSSYTSNTCLQELLFLLPSLALSVVVARFVFFVNT